MKGFFIVGSMALLGNAILSVNIIKKVNNIYKEIRYLEERKGIPNRF